jgi:all-trans-8'-apo-beta-carotenal 15,15'-oxygenase
MTLHDQPRSHVGKSANASAGTWTDADRRAWHLGYRTLEHELNDCELPVVGELPPELAGTLHRVGPARHDVFGDRYRHWFDGDGMVHALSLANGRARYTNRFVRTAGLEAEQGAGRRLFPAFGTRAAGSAIERFRHRLPKNAANTNVVLHAGKLLALWEGARPHALDPVTLASAGVEDFEGLLGPLDAFSAHPKHEAATGSMWNFGVDYRGGDPRIHLYETDRAGHTRRAVTVAMPFNAMIHDFAITATKAVFVLPPYVLPRVPVGLLLGQRSFGESLRWRPELGTRIAIVDLRTGETRWHTTQAIMLFHTINAWDDDTGGIVLDVCAYPDATVFRTLSEVMDEAGVPTPSRAWPERLRITTKAVRVETVTSARLGRSSLEFPRVAPGYLGREHTRAYGIGWPEGDQYLGVPTAIDAGGAVNAHAMPPGTFAGELVPVRKARAGASERDVWLLSFVLDARRERTELWVLDGEDLRAPPVARVRLPHVVPFGFHGNWSPAG